MNQQNTFLLKSATNREDIQSSSNLLVPFFITIYHKFYTKCVCIYIYIYIYICNSLEECRNVSPCCVRFIVCNASRAGALLAERRTCQLCQLTEVPIGIMHNYANLFIRAAERQQREKCREKFLTSDV